MSRNQANGILVALQAAWAAVLREASCCARVKFLHFELFCLVFGALGGEMRGSLWLLLLAPIAFAPMWNAPVVPFSSTHHPRVSHFREAQVFGFVRKNRWFEFPGLEPISGIQLYQDLTPLKVFSDFRGAFRVPDGADRKKLFLSFESPLLTIIDCYGECRKKLYPVETDSNDAHIFFVDSQPPSSQYGAVYKINSEAERNVFFHLQRARTYVSRLVKSRWLNTPLAARVNSRRRTCTATAVEQGRVSVGGYFEFYAEGKDTKTGLTCVNTGLLPSAIYHEWAHGLIDEFLRYRFEDEDKAASEAEADIIAFHLTGDPKIGRGMFKNVDKDENYARDVAARDSNGRPFYYPHDVPTEPDEFKESLILSGAMWDLRKAFIRKYGEVSGNEKSLSLFLRALQIKQKYTELFDALLLVDDNDGNSANGTPHKKMIEKAFGERCLARQNKAPYCPV
jgi:hypothetical protein